MQMVLIKEEVWSVINTDNQMQMIQQDKLDGKTRARGGVSTRQTQMVTQSTKLGGAPNLDPSHGRSSRRQQRRREWGADCMVRPGHQFAGRPSKATPDQSNPALRCCSLVILWLRQNNCSLNVSILKAENLASNAFHGTLSVPVGSVHQNPFFK